MVNIIAFFTLKKENLSTGLALVTDNTRAAKWQQHPNRMAVLFPWLIPQVRRTWRSAAPHNRQWEDKAQLPVVVALSPSHPSWVLWLLQHAFYYWYGKTEFCLYWEEALIGPWTTVGTSIMTAWHQICNWCIAWVTWTPPEIMHDFMTFYLSLVSMNYVLSFKVRKNEWLWTYLGVRTPLEVCFICACTTWVEGRGFSFSQGCGSAVLWLSHIIVLYSLHKA